MLCASHKFVNFFPFGKVESLEVKIEEYSHKYYPYN